jgi:succinate dehydrogenase flavin-adding protein (antitoxin of CptAB toxin-antitoxin module)
MQPLLIQILKHMPIHKLAKLLNTTPNQIKSWLNNTSTPPDHIANKIIQLANNTKMINR